MRPLWLPFLLAVAFAYPVQFLSAQAPSPDPRLHFWRALKTPLQKADGGAYFESMIKGAWLPGGANGVRGLRGTVVSSHPAEHPIEVVLAVSDAHTPEVTLRFVDKSGMPDHFKSALAPGTRVAFAGVAKEFTKDPFMLTLEAQLGGTPDFGFAVVVEAPEQSGLMPSVWVSDPGSRISVRMADISLESLPQHKFIVNDRGTITEMAGVLLERLLLAAGWYNDADNERPHYALQIEGAQSTYRMPDFDKESLEKRAWIALTGGHGSSPDASLILVQADGTLIQEVDGIRRILVAVRQ